MYLPKKKSYIDTIAIYEGQLVRVLKQHLYELIFPVSCLQFPFPFLFRLVKIYFSTF